ncbi:hypothetical protein BAY1663_01185 [Pseudomonas sp. BAY1663]|nr:hypothetical protein BAY1663_01185 [Pseudomonas sp. BAY1663]
MQSVSRRDSPISASSINASCCRGAPLLAQRFRRARWRSPSGRPRSIRRPRRVAGICSAAAPGACSTPRRSRRAPCSRGIGCSSSHRCRAVPGRGQQMKGLRVLRSGPLSLLQDAGRFGWQHLAFRRAARWICTPQPGPIGCWAIVGERPCWRSRWAISKPRPKWIPGWRSAARTCRSVWMARRGRTGRALRCAAGSACAWTSPAAGSVPIWRWPAVFAWRKRWAAWRPGA